jgi:hypothetical protein
MVVECYGRCIAESRARRGSSPTVMEGLPSAPSFLVRQESSISKVESGAAKPSMTVGLLPCSSPPFPAAISDGNRRK